MIEERRGVGAVAAVDDIDRAPGTSGSAVAAAHPIHRPPAAIEFGRCQRQDFVGAVTAQPIGQRLAWPEQPRVAIESDREVLIDQMLERLTRCGLEAGELLGPARLGHETAFSRRSDRVYMSMCPGTALWRWSAATVDRTIVCLVSG
ncbi:hypothetical protein [Nocardia xishanensis]|uniref:hypothetical protein n=1 Tax=Nocardia xishanensis TaxID=238964 RepID=UPI0012F47F1A|nr:hypothetical protein [Nocardia xishanensis]